jgi:hypothetical protein
LPKKAKELKKAVGQGGAAGRASFSLFVSFGKGARYE